MASRTSLAATARSVLSVNSSVTRLEPKEDEEEIDFSPLTRATPPSMMRVICWSMVWGAAPSSVVRTVMTGWSVSGNSRTSMPNHAARPATTISVLNTSARIGRRMNRAVNPPDFPSVEALMG